MKVHKLVIDSWPTPDGKPFADQDEDVWVALAEAYFTPGEGEWPSWLPEFDCADWMPTDSERGGMQNLPVRSGHAIGGTYQEDHIMNVPHAPTRIHFFSELAAQKRLDTLTEWGVIGHIESSAPVEWPTTARPPLSTTGAESDTGTHTERESAGDEGISHE